MRTLALLLSAAVLAVPTAAPAQTGDKTPMQESPASLNQQNHTTQGPDAMGNTGWSGPHRGATDTGPGAAPTPSDSADKQPPVATGEDLKGPPKAFPSNKAPE